MLNLAQVARIARSLAPVKQTPEKVKGALRATQEPPDGDWRTWLVLAGRGWGKSLTLANQIVTWAEEHPGCRIGIAARTSADLRDTLLYGESGIMTQAIRPPRHVAQRRRLEWPNGSQAILLSADEPRQGRGHNFHYAAADELMAWPHPERPGSLWHNLRLATRLPGPLGTRLVAATTPLPSDLLRGMVADAEKGPLTRVTRGRTEENADNLSPDFLTETRGQWGGTRWARQELDGEILGDAEGALWSRDVNLTPYRVPSPPPLSYVVVGVDPSVGDGSGCACGIVVVGVGFDGHLYVLADYTLSAGPAEWAAAVIKARNDFKADLIVAEGNQGGQLVKQVLLGVDPWANVVIVNARRGKRARAEPVAALYDKGFVHHVGGDALTKLEDEMVSWGAYSEASPNRIDALVWGCTHLLPYTHDAVYQAEKARQEAAKDEAERARDQVTRDQEAYRKSVRDRNQRHTNPYR
jgi:phage terminase large subunit-like protein